MVGEALSGQKNTAPAAVFSKILLLSDGLDRREFGSDSLHAMPWCFCLPELYITLLLFCDGNRMNRFSRVLL